MKWYAITDEPLKIYGLAVREKGKFLRLPENIIDQVNPGVTNLARQTAGGRVRFRTDAEDLVIQYVPNTLPLSQDGMGNVGKSGIDCYVNGVYRGGRAVNYQSLPLTVNIKKQPEMQDVDLYLPAYNGLVQMEIGLPDDAVMAAPRPYTVPDPIVFYGSSITQGAASARPGINYVARVARALDADFINLGFAGSARGETIMAQYIAGLSMRLFVLDYDHNAPNAEHLEKTHFPFYEIIRQAQPDLPIVMLSRPDFNKQSLECHRRRDVIRATYDRARSQGDRKIWFVDGETFFGADDRDNCTADGCHPNDVGFARMAQVLLPVLREVLAIG